MLASQPAQARAVPELSAGRAVGAQESTLIGAAVRAEAGMARPLPAACPTVSPAFAPAPLPPAPFIPREVLPYLPEARPKVFMKQARKRKPLISDVLVRLSDGGFLCILCGFKTKHLSSSIVHERMHTQVKPFKCLHCDYRSSQSGNLRKHEAVHLKSMMTERLNEYHGRTAGPIDGAEFAYGRQGGVNGTPAEPDFRDEHEYEDDELNNPSEETDPASQSATAAVMALAGSGRGPPPTVQPQDLSVDSRKRARYLVGSQADASGAPVDHWRDNEQDGQVKGEHDYAYNTAPFRADLGNFNQYLHHAGAATALPTGSTMALGSLSVPLPYQHAAVASEVQAGLAQTAASAYAYRGIGAGTDSGILPQQSSGHHATQAASARAGPAGPSQGRRAQPRVPAARAEEAPNSQFLRCPPIRLWSGLLRFPIGGTSAEASARAAGGLATGVIRTRLGGGATATLMLGMPDTSSESLTSWRDNLRPT